MSAISNVVFLNISKVCRICLLEAENMRTVFSELDQSEILEVNICNLAEVLTRLTNVPVQPNDGLPTLICPICVSLIFGAYKFQVQFNHTNAILQQYLSDSVKVEAQGEVFDYLGNSNSDFDCDNNVTDSFIDLIAKSQNEHYGRRQTSKEQIQKRQSNALDLKQPKKRGRKPKMKIKTDVDDEDANQSSKGLLHPCPICTKEFTALELREHAHSHKALKKYLNIPAEHKVSPTTKFYKNCDSNDTATSIHNLKEKLHKCVSCELECSASYLRIHLQTHRNQTEYKCDQCQRVFKKLNHLNTHRVKHLKECPFKCDQCGKGFVIKTNYECHMLIHNTNQELPHECSYCLKRFSNPEHLNRHMVMHTENVTYSVKYKVCKCHHCLKTFKDRSDLKAHECVPVEQAVNTRFPCKDLVDQTQYKDYFGVYKNNPEKFKFLVGYKKVIEAISEHFQTVQVQTTHLQQLECQTNVKKGTKSKAVAGSNLSDLSEITQTKTEISKDLPTHNRTVHKLLTDWLKTAIKNIENEDEQQLILNTMREADYQCFLDGKNIISCNPLLYMFQKALYSLKKNSKWCLQKYSRRSRARRARERTGKDGYIQPLITNFFHQVSELKKILRDHEELRAMFHEGIKEINLRNTVQVQNKIQSGLKLENEDQVFNFLQCLVETTVANSRYKSNRGNKYDNKLKLFSTYLFLVGGRLLYETLYANMKNCLPSITTIGRGLMNKHFQEGKFRFIELLDFLEKRNLPKSVWISEDGTKITGRIQYDSKSNKIVGFVIPLVNGIPKKCHFLATPAKKIQNNFQQKKRQNTLT
ncbi:hypothetical protein FQR65_LT09144 [Abscondita terminalis]|nr:hypothetical protein FQR65_LT09144 [Abscondita terminalis]